MAKVLVDSVTSRNDKSITQVRNVVRNDKRLTIRQIEEGVGIYYVWLMSGHFKRRFRDMSQTSSFHEC
jgi:hypothetical protein